MTKKKIGYKEFFCVYAKGLCGILIFVLLLFLFHGLFMLVFLGLCAVVLIPYGVGILVNKILDEIWR